MKTNFTKIQDLDDKWARGDTRPSSSPSEHVDHSLIGPIISVRYEPLPHRILPNVIPFFSVALLPSQAPIPFVFLPFPLLAVRPDRKPALPILDPGIERESGVMRRAEEVNVVWHEQVISDQPRLRIAPRRLNKFMHPWLRDPRLTFFRTY